MSSHSFFVALSASFTNRKLPSKGIVHAAFRPADPFSTAKVKFRAVVVAIVQVGRFRHGCLLGFPEALFFVLGTLLGGVTCDSTGAALTGGSGHVLRRG